jgi:hypothetical protein
MELKTLRPGSCKKRAELARAKQTVATKGQLETEMVTHFSEKFGLAANRKEGQKPDNNRNLTL